MITLSSEDSNDKIKYCLNLLDESVEFELVAIDNIDKNLELIDKMLMLLENEDINKIYINFASNGYKFKKTISGIKMKQFLKPYKVKKDMNIEIIEINNKGDHKVMCLRDNFMELYKLNLYYLVKDKIMFRELENEFNDGFQTVGKKNKSKSIKNKFNKKLNNLRYHCKSKIINDSVLFNLKNKEIDDNI